ncbi:unnamed protein product [Alopecurus aequalis]
MATSPENSKIRPSQGESPVRGELLVDEILTRLPIAAAVRFRAVCREWHAALTSDHFITVQAARARAARHPEIISFSPTAGSSTSFYACSLPVDDGGAPAATARKLLTVGGLVGEHIVLSGNRPCRGLTLVFDVRLSEYYVFNLSTCEPAAKITRRFPRPLDQRFPRFALELSSTGLGFDPTTGEHKVVQLFRSTLDEQKCEFGWVHCMQPNLSRHICHLTNFDGNLCAIIHNHLIDDMLLLLTWSRESPSWSVRCRVEAGSLPQPIRGELSGEREIIPLCTVTTAEGKEKVLLATSWHKVYAYDSQSVTTEEVFSMHHYIDVPYWNNEAQLNIGLLEERIAGVGRTLAGGTRLQVVKRDGDKVISKRGVLSEL